MEATTKVLGSVTSSTIQLGSTVINATGTGIINTTNSIATLVGLQQPDDAAEEPEQQAAAADDGDSEAGEEEEQHATESQRPKSLKERAVARVLTPARAVQSRLTEIARSQAEAAREASEAESRAASDAAAAAERMATRVARQQASLRSDANLQPDETLRVFQCRVRSVAIENVSDKPITDRIFIRFVIGGGAPTSSSSLAPQKRPSSNRKRTRLDWLLGTGQPSVLRTACSPADALPAAGAAAGSASSQYRFPTIRDDLRYWFGTYDHLELEELLIEVWATPEARSIGKRLMLLGRRPAARKLGTHAIPLIHLAQGSAELEFMIYTAQKGKPFVKLRLLCFFEEVCEYRLQFVQWRGSKLRASDLPSRRALRKEAAANRKSSSSSGSDAAAEDDEEEDDEAGAGHASGSSSIVGMDAYGNRGSSDPYIVFSIDPPSPSELGFKILRRGGYFGRTTRTDLVLSSLEPSWSEARHPLSYLGTRSELENEVHTRSSPIPFLCLTPLTCLHPPIPFLHRSSAYACMIGMPSPPMISLVPPQCL